MQTIGYKITPLVDHPLHCPQPDCMDSFIVLFVSLSQLYRGTLSLSLFIRLQFSLYLAASVLRSLSNLPHSCCFPLSSLSSHRCLHSVLTSNSDCLSQKKIFITYNLQSQNFQTTHAILLLQQTSKSTLAQTSAYYDR